MGDFVESTVRVAAPATSANLGPGFDSFGLALNLYDVVEARVAGRGVHVDVAGEGASELPTDESHLVVSAMRATFDLMGVSQPGLGLACRNSIPQGRGLGSSAAAIVSGVLLADALVGGGAVTPDQALELATATEGHPDNVAACLLGGFSLAWQEAGVARAVRLDVHAEVRPAAFIAPSALSTSLARGLLPSEVPHAVASANAGRAALLVAALTTSPALLLAATQDGLHQEFRRPAMPESLALVDSLRAAGVPAVISGAGPSVLAFGTTGAPIDTRSWTPASWVGQEIAVNATGASVVTDF